LPQAAPSAISEPRQSTTVPNISKTSAFTSASSGFIFSGSLREATLLEGDGKGKNKSAGQTGEAMKVVAKIVGAVV